MPEPPAPASPPQGKQFGRYLLQRELGRGGMGIVYQAVDPQIGRAVALKVLLGDDACSDPDRVKRFMREAHAISKLRHPNVIQIHDMGEIDSQHYFTMEFVEGGSLEDKIRHAQNGKKEPARLVPPPGQAPSRSPTRGLGMTTRTQAVRPSSGSTPSLRAVELSKNETAGPYNLFDTLVLVRDVARALGAAHALSMVHRDVKPANILIDKKGTPFLTDFGLAKETGELARSVLTLTGTVIGTPKYMSPEQAAGRVSDLRAPSDVWSLGIVLYELLTLKCPFDGNSLGELFHDIAKRHPPVPSAALRAGKKASSGTMRTMSADVAQGMLARSQAGGPRVPSQVDLIVMKCLEKEPAARYADGNELADDIERFLAGKEVAANASMVLQQTKITAQRKRSSAAQRATSRKQALYTAVIGLPVAAIALLIFLNASRKNAEEAAHAGAITEAKARIEARKWKSAMEWIDEKLREYPSDPALEEKRRDVEREMSRVREAIYIADQAFDRKDFVAAQASYKDALAIDPFEEKAKSRYEDVQRLILQIDDAVGKGDELMRSGDADKALGFYTQALALNPADLRAKTGAERAKNALAVVKKGPSAMSQGTTSKEAEACYEKARHRPVETREVWAEALANVDKALSIDPNYGDAWHERGVLDMKLEKLQDAMDDFAKAIQHGSFLVYSHYYRGRILFDDYNDAADARIEFQAAIDADPTHEYVLAARARMAAADGDLARALDFANQALEKTKTLDDVWFVMGYVYGADQYLDLEKALQCFNKAIDLNPTVSESWGNRAVIHYRRKEYEAGLRDAEKGLELTGGSARMLDRKALNLSGMEKYADAVASWDEAEKKAGDRNVSTFINRGDCYRKWGLSLKSNADLPGARDKLQHTVKDWEHFLKLVPTGPYHDAVAKSLADVRRTIDALR